MLCSARVESTALHAVLREGFCSLVAAVRAGTAVVASAVSLVPSQNHSIGLNATQGRTRGEELDFLPYYTSQELSMSQQGPGAPGRWWVCGVQRCRGVPAQESLTPDFSPQLLQLPSGSGVQSQTHSGPESMWSGLWSSVWPKARTAQLAQERGGAAAAQPRVLSLSLLGRV